MRKKRKYEMGRPAAATKLGPKRIHLLRCRGGNLKHRALRIDTGNFSWGTEALTRKTRILAVVYNASNNELVRTNTLVKNSIIQVDATPFRQWYERHYGVSIGKKKLGKQERAAKTAAAKKDLSQEQPKEEKAKEAPKEKAKEKSKEQGKAKGKGKEQAKGKGKEQAKEKSKEKSKEQGKEKAATDAASTASADKKEKKAKSKKRRAKVDGEVPVKRSHSVRRKVNKRKPNASIEQTLEDQFSTGRLLACVSSRPGQSGRCDGYILEGKELEFYQKKLLKKKSGK
jgi:ribosomal protein eS8